MHFPGRVIEPAGSVARCHEYIAANEDIEGIAIMRMGVTAVLGLPDPAPDTVYIVSMMVRLALPNRHDLASPGRLERGPDGQVTCVRNLVMNP